MDEDIFKYIDVERTIAEFGYDPRGLTKGSSKFVIPICITCNDTRDLITFRSANKSKECRSCASKNAFNKNKKFKSRIRSVSYFRDDSFWE